MHGYGDYGDYRRQHIVDLGYPIGMSELFLLDTRLMTRLSEIAPRLLEILASCRGYRVRLASQDKDLPDLVIAWAHWRDIKGVEGPRPWCWESYGWPGCWHVHIEEFECSGGRPMMEGWLVYGGDETALFEPDVIFTDAESEVNVHFRLSRWRRLRGCHPGWERVLWSTDQPVDLRNDSPPNRAT